MNASPVTIAGNVTGDPEVREISSGHKMAKFSVAAEHRYRKGEEWVSETSFFNVTAWRFLAEDAERVLRKGVRVVVIGRLQQRTWEDDDGNKRSIVEVVAEEIGLGLRSIDDFERRTRAGAAGGAPAAAPEPDVW